MGASVPTGSLACALAALAAMGCMPVRYVVQAGCGQLDLASRTRPLAEVVRDERVEARTRRLLAEVPSIKRYARESGLEPTESYRSFVALDRPVVVWVVSASEPLRLRAKTWSFPIVGRVPYLGWFDAADAQDHAMGLVDEGWDVDLRGASAYSTLGYFEDAVLSTMIADGDEALGELANVVLHESTHATLYLPGQSALNESVASFVGDELAAVWLAASPVATAAEREAYLEGQREGDRRAKAMHETYLELESLYASSRSDEDKLAEKHRILSDLRARVGFRRPISNATLLQSKTYGSGRRELAALLVACGGSYARLLGSLATLRSTRSQSEGAAEVGALIQPLVDAGCPKAPAG